MALTKVEKSAVVDEVHAFVARSQSLTVIDVSGMPNNDLTALRREARAAGVEMRMVRNTLLKVALDGTGYEGLKDTLVGQTVLASSPLHPGAAAKLIAPYAKAESLIVKNIALGSDVLDGSAVQDVAEMPTREEALSIVAGLMLSPLSAVATALSDVGGRVARAIDAVRVQSENNS